MSSSILHSKLRRDLRQKRRQVFAVAATVFIGVGLFVVSWDMYNNLRDSYDLTYEETKFADVWARVDPESAALLRDAPGVVAVEMRTSAAVPMVLGDGPISGRIQGLPVESQPEINQVVIQRGTYLQAAQPDGVLVESHTADNFDLAVGDSIELNREGRWFDADIVGIVSSPEWLWLAPSAQEFITDPNEFGVVFTSEELASQIAPAGSLQAVALVAEHSVETAQSVVSAAYGAGATEAFDRAQHPSNQALQSDVKGFRQMAILFPILFLGVAALATSVLLSRLINTQRGDIGMMRAFGFGEGQILRHFIGYGLATVLAGAIPAIVLGTFGAKAATTAYTSFLSVPFASTKMSPLTWTIALGFSIALGVIAGYLPARAAARIEPAAAMLTLGSEVQGRRTILERLLPSRAPSWAIVAVRNIRRQPRRAASTMVGVVLALIMIVSAFVMNDSINSVFTRQFGEIDQRDLVVTLEGPASIDAFASIDGIASAEPYGETAVLLSSDSGFATQQLQGFAAGTPAHEFPSGSSFGGRGVVLGSLARAELKLEVGAIVSATLPEFGVEAQLVVAGFVDEPISGFSYVDVSTWESLTGAVPTMAVITLHNNNEHRDVRNQVAGLQGVRAVHDQVAIAEHASSLLQASKFFVGVMLFFAMVMAVALIFNAMTVSIGERESEVATLQANGVGRSWIRRTITLENLAIVFAGVVPGLILGRLLGAAFLNQFSTPQFTFRAELSPTSLAASVLIIAVAAVAAQFPGLRSLDKLDLPTKVRERNV